MKTKEDIIKTVFRPKWKSSEMYKLYIILNGYSSGVE